MFLDYLALVMLVVGISLVIYTFIYIHDIPYQIAKKKDHAQKEAIHLACWLSLFTLHAIWPIVFIWAVSHKPEGAPKEPAADGPPEKDVNSRLAQIEERLRRVGILDSEPN